MGPAIDESFCLRPAIHEISEQVQMGLDKLRSLSFCVPIILFTFVYTHADNPFFLENKSLKLCNLLFLCQRSYQAFEELNVRNFISRPPNVPPRNLVGDPV